MNETFEMVSTVQAPDVCPSCLKYSSEGYAEWYEYMPVLGTVLPIVEVPTITPFAAIPAVPEPSTWALVLLGLLASRFFYAKRSVAWK